MSIELNQSKQLSNESAIESYFNNNGRGYQTPEVMTLQSPHLKIELYCNRLKPNKLATIQQDLQAVTAEFFKEFRLSHSPRVPQETIRMYLFNNKEDYQYLGGSSQFAWGLGSEGGKAYYRGKPEVHSELYLYQQGDTLNLKHEMAHALTFYAIQGHSANIHRWLTEGIAEYFGHQKGVVHVSQEESQALTTKALSSLNYSEDPEKNRLLYRMGHAVVSYLQDKAPTLLGTYLATLKNHQPEKAASLLQQALADLPSLKQWLYDHSLEKLFQESHLLKVTPEEHPIGTREEIGGDQVKRKIYHPAVITSQKGETVGRFSPIIHLWQFNTIRAVNNATEDYLDIPKEYSFLKVLKTAQEGLQLGYCDQNGHLYRESQDYQERVLNQVIELVPAWQSTDKAFNQKKEQASADFDKATQKTLKAYRDYEAVKNSGAANSIIDSRLSSLYQQYQTNLGKMEKARKLLLQAQENIKKFKNDLIQSADPLMERFKALLQIAPHQLAEIQQQEVQGWKRNQVLTLKPLGRADLSALSLYTGSSKVGELSTEVGFFQSIDNPENMLAPEPLKEFIYADVLKGLQTRYQDPHLAVSQTDNSYRLSFIEDQSIQGDHHFTEPHFHQNELLKPGLQHMGATDLQPLLFKGTILNHAESPAARYSEEQRKNGIIVKPGELLDDKGTKRTDDDNYAAVVKQGEQLLHHFTSTGFYITEAIKNSQGKITQPSSFFIHDHGRNVRWQLPKAITHLKLVTNSAGQRKLVPCEANGNEFPEGMPDIPDDDRFIDLLFAHRYAKRDHSQKHTNIGLINFDSYPTGTRFAIQYDPKDPSIHRDKQGNILRDNPRRSYMTKVKLWHGNQEIGMLSNSFHNFTGKIFFSADLNYSYTDFLASVSPQVVVETTADGGKKISFNRGAGDLAGTDRGYTDQAVIFDRAAASQQPAPVAARMATPSDKKLDRHHRERTTSTERSSSTVQPSEIKTLLKQAINQWLRPKHLAADEQKAIGQAIRTAYRQGKTIEAIQGMELPESIQHLLKQQAVHYQKPRARLERQLEQWSRQANTDNIQQAIRRIAADRMMAVYDNRSDQLDLQNLGLTRLPAAIGELTSLKTLLLSKNKLETLPQQLNKLTRLQSIDCRYNPLSNPPQVFKLLAQSHAGIVDRVAASQQPAQLVADMASLKEPLGGDSGALGKQEPWPRFSSSSRLLRTHD